MEQIETFCFCSDNKRTKSKRFGFVPIISFDIETFLLSFRSHFPQQAEREKERTFIYLLRATTFIIIREGGIRDGEIEDGEIEEGGCEIVEA